MNESTNSGSIYGFDAFGDFLMHYGVLRKSGRYPWGSGDDPYQRNGDFLSAVAELSKNGMSDADIAKALLGQKDNGKDFTSTDLRALKSIAKSANRAADISRAQQLKLKGLSNVAIGEKMGLNESSIRSLLDPGLKERNDSLQNIADLIKERIGTDGIVDIGTGTENQIGVAASKKSVAIAMLEEEGYKRFYIPQDQLGTGKITTRMVLAAPGTTFPDVIKRKSEILMLQAYSDDNGRTFEKIKPPVSVNPDRVGVRWGPDGGAAKDGVIELRRGVDDLSLGEARYAQVRVKIGKEHYLKGMAMYSDNMPDGVDILFNTNKDVSSNKFDAMKPIKIDKATGKQDTELPFGSIVRQKHYTDSDGKTKQSPLNIVGTSKKDDNGNDISISGEEGNWNTWSKTLSSQFLSKQTTTLARQQLELSFRAKKDEYDTIVSLTNPAVKKKLLTEFADGADSAAKQLKAAGLPRTASHVILPINSLKDNEIYAPNYNNGENVVLIRHPHGGKFEIPELKVNNRNREALRLIKNAKDAVGINSNVAIRLSGADFDGDTVLVVPNDSRAVKTSPALTQLRNFDPQTDYKGYDGMPVMKGKQKQMGDISNLITDMTLKGASEAELARAVKHSMVVIDAEKHKLNYKQSYLDQNIAQLKTKYQKGPRSGASTLISLAKSTEYVDERKPRPAALGGPIDKNTGEKVFVKTGNEYTVAKVSALTGKVKYKVVKKTTKSTKMDETKDAHSLSSGTVMEGVYATHANRLKSLANNARKEAVNIGTRPVSKVSRVTYAEEVKTLRSKLNAAQKNAPLERQAQMVAAAIVSAKRAANPDLEASEIKKLKSQALTESRARLGAKKAIITFTSREWEAVQAGAVATSVLDAILNNADMAQVRSLATPRDQPVMSSAKVSRAEGMAALGYSQAEIASALGVSTSTLSSALA